MSFTDPFHKPEEKIEDYSDVFDKDDWNAMLINEARTAINKLVAPSIIETISNSIQSERWFWNPTKNRGCIPGPGTNFVMLYSLTKSDFEKAIKSSIDKERLVAISESKWDKKYEKLTAAIYLERLSASSVYKRFYLVRYSELLDFVKPERMR